jgi:hypothetical protein
LAAQDAFGIYCKEQFCDENIRFWSDADVFLKKYWEDQERLHDSQELNRHGNESTISIAANTPRYASPAGRSSQGFR